jgi:hypothetical protein
MKTKKPMTLADLIRKAAESNLDPETLILHISIPPRHRGGLCVEHDLLDHEVGFSFGAARRAVEFMPDYNVLKPEDEVRR